MKECTYRSKYIKKGILPFPSLSFLRLDFETLGRKKKKETAGWNTAVLWQIKHFYKPWMQRQACKEGRSWEGRVSRASGCWQGWHSSLPPPPHRARSLPSQLAARLRPTSASAASKSSPTETRGSRGDASGLPGWEPLKPARLPTARNCTPASPRLPGFSHREFHKILSGATALFTSCKLTCKSRDILTAKQTGSTHLDDNTEIQLELLAREFSRSCKIWT